MTLITLIIIGVIIYCVYCAYKSYQARNELKYGETEESKQRLLEFYKDKQRLTIAYGVAKHITKLNGRWVTLLRMNSYVKVELMFTRYYITASEGFVSPEYVKPEEEDKIEYICSFPKLGMNPLSDEQIKEYAYVTYHMLQSIPWLKCKYFPGGRSITICRNDCIIPEAVLGNVEVDIPIEIPDELIDQEPTFDDWKDAVTPEETIRYGVLDSFSTPIPKQNTAADNIPMPTFEEDYYAEEREMIAKVEATKRKYSALMESQLAYDDLISRELYFNVVVRCHIFMVIVDILKKCQKEQHISSLQLRIQVTELFNDITREAKKTDECVSKMYSNDSAKKEEYEARRNLLKACLAVNKAVHNDEIANLILRHSNSFYSILFPNEKEFNDLMQKAKHNNSELFFSVNKFIVAKYLAENNPTFENCELLQDSMNKVRELRFPEHKENDSEGNDKIKVQLDKKVANSYQEAQRTVDIFEDIQKTKS